MKKWVALFAAVFVFLSCSSAPKRIMLVTDKSNLAYSQLEAANTSIAEERYSRAFSLLTSGYSLALSVDNTELLCKILLSAVVFRLSCPNLADFVPAADLDHTAAHESFLVQSKEELLAQAQKCAARSADKQVFSALCSVYEVRVLLENEKSELEGRISAQSARKYAAALDAARPSVAKEPFYLAYLLRTGGDVCMAGGDYASAQQNYREAAKIHTKERYLSEIGLDWYCVARSCSLEGQKAEAVSAIQTALKYDKDAENSRGIAADYRAYAKILLRGSPSEEERELSRELEAWAQKISDAAD